MKTKQSGMLFNQRLIIATAFFVIAISANYLITQTQANKSGFSKNQQIFNAKSCIADDCLVATTQEYPLGELDSEAVTALNKAIDDEYKALSTYQKVIAKFGMVRPFSMIIRAEETHITSLKALFDKYGLKIPKNNWEIKSLSLTTISAACQMGVIAEVANADLYKNTLLPAVTKHADITSVFTNLMNASEQKHLVAFEKCD